MTLHFDNPAELAEWLMEMEMKCTCRRGDVSDCELHGTQVVVCFTRLRPRKVAQANVPEWQVA